MSTFTPDYSVDFLPTNPWIHQPFEGYDEPPSGRSAGKVESLILKNNRPRPRTCPPSSFHHPYAPPGGLRRWLLVYTKASTVLTTYTISATVVARQNISPYGLHGTPTTFTLEERIATLEAVGSAYWCQWPGKPSVWWTWLFLAPG